MLKKIYDGERLVRVVSDNVGKALKFFRTQEKIVVFHHDDADGKLGGRMVYEAFRLDNTKRFHCCNYGTKMPNPNMVKEGDVVFIVDYCIPTDQLREITEVASLVVFLDHHKTAMDMVAKDFEYYSKLVEEDKLIIDLDMGRCGAKIASEYFISIGLDKGWNEKVVDLVDKYDRWTKEDPRADYLNQFIYNSSMSYVNSQMWYDLLYDEEYFQRAISIGKEFFDINLHKNELTFRSFAKETEFHGLKISVIEGFGNSQLFGDHIDDYDAVCVFHITNNGKWQHSIYSSKPGSGLNKIAEIYGGGGHKSAAGFILDERIF